MMNTIARALPHLAASLLLGVLPLSRALAQQAPEPDRIALPHDAPLLPDRSPAGADDATATTVNPAGLAFMNAPEIGYAGVWALPDDERTVPEGHALFFSGGQPGLGFGLTAQSLYHPDLLALSNDASYRRYGAGFAFGDGEHLGLGASFFLYGSDTDPDLDDLATVDLGAIWRAQPSFALGLWAREINSPFLDRSTIVRPTVGASALWRPWSGRLQLEASAERGLRDDLVALSPRILLEPLPGRRLFARADFEVTSASSIAQSALTQLTAGIELSVDPLGASLASVSARRGDTAPSGVALGLWLSPQKRRSITEPAPAWAVVNLTQPLADLPVDSLFGPTSASFVELLADLDAAARDPSLSGVVLNLGASSLGWAQIHEINERVGALRAAGKRVAAYLQTAGTKELVAAAQADRLWLAPQTLWAPTGVGVEFVHYQRALRLAGVRAEFLRVRDFKSAPEDAVLPGPSDAARAQIDAILDQTYQAIIASIAARGLTPSDARAALAATPLLPDEAVERGLVDAIYYADELDAAIEEAWGERPTVRPNLRPIERRDELWETPAEIAVVVLDGAIIDGPSAQNPLLGGSLVGSDTIVETLANLASARSVRAVVLRVNSPGGSALASDVIYRGVRALARRKPVVASMGDIAASGGYYVSAGAQTIYASPTTITGSIGIFAGKYSLGALSARLGVDTEGAERGPVPNPFSPWTPFTESQRAALTTSLAYLYELFLTQIASARSMTRQSVDAAARGRVWTGLDAQKQGLVDEIGGFPDALADAARRAALPPGGYRIRLYPQAPSSIATSLLGLLLSEQADPSPPLLGVLARLIAPLRSAALPLLYPPGTALALPAAAIEIR